MLRTVRMASNQCASGCAATMMVLCIDLKSTLRVANDDSFHRRSTSLLASTLPHMSRPIIPVTCARAIQIRRVEWSAPSLLARTRRRAPGNCSARARTVVYLPDVLHGLQHVLPICERLAAVPQHAEHPAEHCDRRLVDHVLFEALELGEDSDRVCEHTAAWQHAREHVSGPASLTRITVPASRDACARQSWHTLFAVAAHTTMGVMRGGVCAHEHALHRHVREHAPAGVHMRCPAGARAHAPRV
jgi:hypothetical protein